MEKSSLGKKMEEMFNQTAKSYATKNMQMNALKKELDPMNKDIKQYMKLNSLKDFEGDTFKLVYSTVTKTKMNEEKLIERLKYLGFHKAIKTVEVPDEAVIEMLMYEGQLSASDLADCVETTVQEKLEVKKKK